MSVLVISDVLGLFVITFVADKKLTLRKSENLPQPIQMKLSKKLKLLSTCSALFLKSTSNFKHFEKIWRSQLMCLPNYWLRKAWLDKCLKRSVPEHRSRANILEGHKDCVNPHGCTFIIFFYHSDKNGIVKCIS